MTLLCGIDEAGKGCVVGDLVLAGVLINQEDEQELQQLGVKDSKLLSLKQRNELFDKIKEKVTKYKIMSVPPSEIDSAVEGEKGLNLNWLEAEKTAQIINELGPDRVIIDSPSNNIKQYKDYLYNKIDNKKTELVVEHKADLNHPVAAAASILAKVTRDRSIEDIHKQVGEHFGSGYASDPRTVTFLERNFDKFPDIFRKSWQTYKNVAYKQFQKGLGDFK